MSKDGLLLCPDVDEEEFDEPILNIETNPNLIIPENVTTIQISQIHVEQKNIVDESNVALDLPSNLHLNEENLLVCSTECTEAMSAIATDCWDISSWMIFLEEVQQGRGGSVAVVDVYDRILVQFPRSSKFWRNLAEYHLSNNDVQIAEEIYQKCMMKCRCIDLWLSYISYLISNFNDTLKGTIQIDQHMNIRNKCEKTFEDACLNVGLSMNSFPLWKSYIDFVKSWPELGMIESGKKLNMLRNVYQRAISICMEQTDEIWNEYEAFEKQNGEITSEAFLPEYNKKYLHGKSITRERKKLICNIIFDRLATPSTNSTYELQQLELWSNWISFEMSKPDYLNPESFTNMLRMIYEQCLCCFLYNSEIWINYAHFEQHKSIVPTPGVIIVTKENSLNMIDARNIYLEAIELNPKVLLLRSALAELEELDGNIEVAKETLRVTFEQMPSGFSFSLLQRFIRRTLGIIAARQLFSETISIRNSSTSSNSSSSNGNNSNDSQQLSLELFLSNAKLELEVNSSPQIALKVLNYARKTIPTCIKDIYYIQAITKVLMILGDINQIRWIFQTALCDSVLDHNSTVTSSLAATTYNTKSTTTINTIGTQKQSQIIGGNSKHLKSSSYTELKVELELWEEYLRVETILGVSNIIRLNELRNHRDRVKQLLDEAERVKLGIVFSTKDEVKAIQRGIFHTAQDLVERYDFNSGCVVWALPEADQEMSERTRISTSGFSSSLGSVSIGGIGLSRDQDRMNALRNILPVTTKKDRDMINMSAEFHLSMSGLPVLLRDFLVKLPFHNGPLPDIDGFIRHMKSIILPPRPSTTILDNGSNTTMMATDDSESIRMNSNISGVTGEYSDILAATTTAAANIPSWMLDQQQLLGSDPDMLDDSKQLGESNVNLLNKMNQEDADTKDDDDVFRKRQRSKKRKVVK